jgi:FkbM family methyltransferase
MHAAVRERVMGLRNALRRWAPPALADAISGVGGRAEAGEAPIVMVDPSIGSYSQYQEDLIIDALLGCKGDGFYVDVGANHPSILSNTKRFYDKGWNGVNIEPDPGLFGHLERERPRDVNLNIGLGRAEGEMEFFMIEPDTLSTFDPGVARKNLQYPGARLVEKPSIRIMKLSQVLSRHASGRPIDFMSVDVEGYEMEVIEGGDWGRNRPRLVVMEIFHDGKALVKAMDERRYRLVFSNGTNGIFLDTEAG